MRLLIGVCLICLPLKVFKINSGYGYRFHPITHQYAMHYGIDLQARQDTVYAIMDGVISSENYNNSLGIYICLENGDFESMYGHLSQVLVGDRDSVFAGQPIAVSGSTGRVTGAHLHFSLRYKKRFIDPLKFFYELLNNQQNERKF